MLFTLFQISEMSQEPRPVSRDCVYPALVGCSAPVEAVLSQISSNMWCVKEHGTLQSPVPAHNLGFPSQVSRFRAAGPSTEHQDGRGPQRSHCHGDQDPSHPLTKDLQCQKGPQELRTAGRTVHLHQCSKSQGGLFFFYIWMNPF